MKIVVVAERVCAYVCLCVTWHTDPRLLTNWYVAICL